MDPNKIVQNEGKRIQRQTLVHPPKCQWLNNPGLVATQYTAPSSPGAPNTIRNIVYIRRKSFCGQQRVQQESAFWSRYCKRYTTDIASLQRIALFGNAGPIAACR